MLYTQEIVTVCVQLLLRRVTDVMIDSHIVLLLYIRIVTKYDVLSIITV